MLRYLLQNRLVKNEKGVYNKDRLNSEKAKIKAKTDEFLQRAGGWCEPVLFPVVPLLELPVKAGRLVPFNVPGKRSGIYQAIWVATRRKPSSHIFVG